jgi:flagellar hook-associated protein 1 FlgK
LAAQAGLNITGQNISNADTDGYSRQRVSTSAIEAAGNGYLINQIIPSTNVGQGVTVTNISQIRSAYLDEQYRSQYADFSSSECMTQGLTYLENLFSELDDDTSLTISISDFFDALSDFADDPTSEAARTTVQQTALSMTESFKLIYNEMLDLYNNQNASVKTVASQINQIAKEIAALNEASSKYEVSGETANDLRDKRNLLFDKLSGYAEISLSDNGSMVDVRIAGETLVEGKTSCEIGINTATDEINGICQQLADLNNDILAAGTITAEQEDTRDALMEALTEISGKITCTVDGADGTVGVTITYIDHTTTAAVTEPLVSGAAFTAAADTAVCEYDGASTEFVLKLGGKYLNTDTLESGELFAHLYLRDSSSASESGIPYYIGQLDELARSIVQSVNECMNTGYTYPDEENGHASVNMVDMFEDFGNSYSLVTAGNFSLSPAIVDSVWNLAASDTEIDLDAEDTQSANNKVALLLAELINTEDYTATLDGLISHLGVDVQSSKNTLDTQQSLLKSIGNQRESVSGVSIDEEAVNLIMYQRTYTACSRVITTMDELLEKLINGTGTVGR